MGYFAQHAMDLLDGDRTVFQSLEDAFPQAGQGSLRSLAGCFGFSGDDVEKKCRVLSGGEKARLVMATMLFDPPNFLVLDEPTNHLDLLTKEMLITALSQYEGAMLFVSHDRHFLAALSNRVLELTPEGVHQYAGGYTEYVARTGHEAPGLRTDPVYADCQCPIARVAGRSDQPRKGPRPSDRLPLRRFPAATPDAGVERADRKTGDDEPDETAKRGRAPHPAIQARDASPGSPPDPAFDAQASGGMRSTWPG